MLIKQCYNNLFPYIHFEVVFFFPQREPLDLLVYNYFPSAPTLYCEITLVKFKPSLRCQ